MTNVLPENAESQRAWDGVLFDRFLRYKHLVIAGLAQHGAVAIDRFPPREGDAALDVGCGFGDTAQALAELVGPSGSVLGVDIAPRFVEAARDDARAVSNLRFEVMDVQASAFDETFDYAFSRFGTMFFAMPVAAFRNIRQALRPGAPFVSVVWRRKLDNPWLHVAEEVVRPLVPEPEETDEARCGPGPFAMANADTVSAQLTSAGFDEIALHRLDLPYKLGNTVDEAVEFNLAIGPAAEAVRLAGPDGDEMRPRLAGLLREALSPYKTADGVIAGSSVWIVTARAAD